MPWLVLGESFDEHTLPLCDIVIPSHDHLLEVQPRTQDDIIREPLLPHYCWVGAYDITILRRTSSWPALIVSTFST